MGKKERNICFFVNESKKRFVFDHKKRNVDITSIGAYWFKGIVSQDWGGLLMVSLD
jgi:hypothetical protein